jgi:hypothetical protein
LTNFSIFFGKKNPSIFDIKKLEKKKKTLVGGEAGGGKNKAYAYFNT